MPSNLDETNYIGLNENLGVCWLLGRGGRARANRARAKVCTCPKAHTALSEVGSGSSATIESIDGDQGFRTKMLAMGLIPGTTVTVVQNGDNQPLLLALSGSRFALDHASSEKITVHRPGRERRKGRA